MIASWGAEVKSPAQAPAIEVWGTLGQYECAGELNSAPYFVRTDDGAVPRYLYRDAQTAWRAGLSLGQLMMTVAFTILPLRTFPTCLAGSIVLMK